MNPLGTRAEGTLTHPNMPSIVGYTNAVGQYMINTKPGKNNTRFLVLITTQSTHSTSNMPSIVGYTNAIWPKYD